VLSRLKSFLTESNFVLIACFSGTLFGVGYLFGVWAEYRLAQKHDPFGGVTLQEGVLYVTGRKWPNVEKVVEGPHLRWLRPARGKIALERELPPAAIAPSSEITILVHGFHSNEKAIVTYFHGLIKYLQRDAKYPGALVFYDWPSLAVAFDPVTAAELRIPDFASGHAPRGQWMNILVGGEWERGKWELMQYALDREQAEKEGVPGLAELVAMLRRQFQPRAINIIAHSMGSWVTLEALRRHAVVMQPVNKVILLAPDAPSSIFDDPSVLAALSPSTSVHVYYSAADNILGLTEMGIGSPGSLGRRGPSTRALPANIHAHDVTNLLAKEDVHSVYLQRAGATAIALADVLR
jgi:pimeloyl-ACP methyl ester carboxylesterase